MLIFLMFTICITLSFAQNNIPYTPEIAYNSDTIERYSVEPITMIFPHQISANETTTTPIRFEINDPEIVSIQARAADGTLATETISGNDITFSVNDSLHYISPPLNPSDEGVIRFNFLNDKNEVLYVRLIGVEYGKRINTLYGTYINEPTSHKK